MILPIKSKSIFLFLFLTLSSFHICWSQTVFKKDTVSSELGHITFKTNLESFYLVVDNNYKKAIHLSDQDTLTLKKGIHNFRLVKKFYMDVTKNIDIKPNNLIKFSTNLLPFRNFKYYKDDSSYPRLFWGAPVIVKAEPDARLYIDDHYIGTGIGRVDTTGFVTVRSELPGGNTKRIRFSTKKEGQTFYVKTLYQKPQRKKSLLLSLVPGGTQIYQGDKIKGYAFLGTTLIATGLAVKYHLEFDNKYQQFRSNREAYLTADDPNIAFKKGNLAEQQLSKANSLANTRDKLLYGAIGLYLYNIVDALLKPDVGYRDELEIDPYLDFDKSELRNLGIKTTINF